MALARAIRPRSSRLKRRPLTAADLKQHTPQDFAQVAAFIVSPSPDWLMKQLQLWSISLWLSYAIESRQASRAELRALLEKVESSAQLLIKALSHSALVEFLYTETERPRLAPGDFLAVLGALSRSANALLHSPEFADESGRTRPGAGRPLVNGAMPAKTYCALIISEAYRYFRDRFPATRNEKVNRAAERYWQLSGGPHLAVGEDSWTGWRSHFEAARSPALDKEREEIRRRLSEGERDARRLAHDQEIGS